MNIIKDIRGNSLEIGDKVCFVYYNEMFLGEVTGFTKSDNIRIAVYSEGYNYQFPGYYPGKSINRSGNLVVKIC